MSAVGRFFKKVGTGIWNGIKTVGSGIKNIFTGGGQSQVEQQPPETPEYYQQHGGHSYGYGNPSADYTMQDVHDYGMRDGGMQQGGYMANPQPKYIGMPQRRFSRNNYGMPMMSSRRLTNI